MDVRIVRIRTKSGRGWYVGVSAEGESWTETVERLYNHWVTPPGSPPRRIEQFLPFAEFAGGRRVVMAYRFRPDGPLLTDEPAVVVTVQRAG